MIIKGTVRVELNSDQLTDAIVDALCADYGYLAKDVASLMDRSDLEEYEQRDLEHDLMLMQAIDRVLSNYMLYEEHKTFKNAWKKYVDLYKDRNFKDE
jgi:hypothetical protein